jgi:hypothetical protein
MRTRIAWLAGVVALVAVVFAAPAAAAPRFGAAHHAPERSRRALAATRGRVLKPPLATPRSSPGSPTQAPPPASSARAATPATTAPAAPTTPGAKALREVVDFLLGEWTGEGTGDPGQAGGGFTFESSLDGNIVTRRSRADYPAAGGRPAVHHEDFTVMFAERGQVRANYFDNEGHVIHYAVAFAHESATVVFLSDLVEGQPRYRLTYRPLGKDHVETLFEIAPPDKPTGFQTYVKGICRRAR